MTSGSIFSRGSGQEVWAHGYQALRGQIGRGPTKTLTIVHQSGLSQLTTFEPQLVLINEMYLTRSVYNDEDLREFHREKCDFVYIIISKIIKGLLCVRHCSKLSLYTQTHMYSISTCHISMKRCYYHIVNPILLARKLRHKGWLVLDDIGQLSEEAVIWTQLV